MLLADDLTQLLDVLPSFLSVPLEKHPRREQLLKLYLILAGDPRPVFLQALIIFHTEQLFGKI